MLRSRWALLSGLLLVVALLAWGWRTGGGAAGAVDLVKSLPQAEKRSAPLPVAQAIQVVTATVNREAKLSILAKAHSRILFRVRPPAEARFSASIAVDPAAWDKEGDGVLFRVGVGDGKGIYKELLSRHVNPAGRPADRRWIPVSVDLAAFAGQDIYLILNTSAGPSGRPDDLRNDLALWGAPRLASGR